MKETKTKDREDMKTIRTDSLEIFKHPAYELFQIGSLHGFVNQNAYISIVATNNCQCNCPYCINSATDRQKNLPIEKALHNIGELTTYINNEPEVIILGGEPTLHPQIFDLIRGLKGLKRYGFNALGKVRITTNGIRLKDPEFLQDLLDSGIDGINISWHNEKEFMSLPELRWIVDKIHTDRKDCKVRINTNVWRGNHDTVQGLQSLVESLSFADSIRVSNIIPKDSFSVNPDNFGTDMILSDEEYKRLFRGFIRTFENNYAIFENPNTLGFVRYFLIPRPCPIIVNWNLGSTVSEQICENDGMRKVNTFKCLVSGDISLSWNTNNIIEL